MCSSASFSLEPQPHTVESTERVTFPDLITCPAKLLPFLGSDIFCCRSQIACGDLKGGFGIGQEGSSHWKVFGILRSLDPQWRQPSFCLLWRKLGQFV